MVDSYINGRYCDPCPGPGVPRTKVEDIRKLGDEDIRASASVSNALLDKPVAAIRDGGEPTETSTVSRSLLELRRTVEDSIRAAGRHVQPEEAVGVLPFGTGDKSRLLPRYKSSRSTHRDHRLADPGKTRSSGTTRRSSSSSSACGRPRVGCEQLYIGKALDSEAGGEDRAARYHRSDPSQGSARGPPVLRPPEGPRLATQMAVWVQGYLALDLVRKNNVELIKGVDRATTTTVSALRTAVTVAQALADQKLVLDQITALNTTTDNIIVSTRRCCATQSAKIHEQAASSTVGSRSSRRPSRTSTPPWMTSTPSRSRR